MRRWGNAECSELPRANARQLFGGVLLILSVILEGNNNNNAVLRSHRCTSWLVAITAVLDYSARQAPQVFLRTASVSQVLSERHEARSV